MNIPPIPLHRIFNFLLIAACAAILSEPAFAQSSLTDDAHTNTSPRSADSNFGTNPNLTVSSSGNVYIKFNLGSTLPAATPGSQVEKATLKLFIGNISSAGKLDVYEVVGAWQESTITANNAPILGSLVGTTQQITTDQRGKFLVIDITETVRQWLGSDGQGAGGIPNHGIALIAHPVDANTPEIINITFDSKENSQTSHEPRLNIYLKDDADNGLETVAHDTTLTGDGTAGSPLGVAAGAISATQLSAGAVTETKLADGSVTSAKITAPLSLASADPAFTLSVMNAGGGPAITAAGAINTSTQYNIGGSRVLSVPGTNNLFVGLGAGRDNIGIDNSFFGRSAGLVNTFGSGNAFFGAGAGQSNTESSFNSFFGRTAGGENTTGIDNSYFGAFAGLSNTTGGRNSFFGRSAGFNNTGNNNSFFGAAAGQSSTSGDQNQFFGAFAGFFNTTGSNNSYIGYFAGFSNIAGDKNTVIGSLANVGADNLQNATAIGADARVDQSNSLVLGSISGINGAAATVNVGIGTTAPTDRLHVNGTIRVDSLGGAGVTQLCRNASNQISDCSSSLRYKHHLVPFTAGLVLIEQLRPISYTWKRAGTRDIGFGAEEVARVDPLLVTRNANGEVEGVKYDRIAVVLVNAVKEQQQIIKAQQALLESQQRQIDILKKLVCLDRPDALFCK